MLKGVASRPERMKAFTLVEVLVVVGIVAILVGLTLGVVSAARRQAKETTCKSNLRQIGQTLLARASANGGQLPPAGHLRLVSSGTPEAALGDSGRQKLLYSEWSFSREKWQVGMLPLSLSDTLASDWKWPGYPPAMGAVFTQDDLAWRRRITPLICPSDPVQAEIFLGDLDITFAHGPGLNSDTGLPQSYASNPFVFSLDERPGMNRVRLKGRLDRVRETSNLALLVEARHAFMDDTPNLLGTSGWSLTVWADTRVVRTLADIPASHQAGIVGLARPDFSRHGARHGPNGRMNVLFADGSVRGIHVKEAANVLVMNDTK